MKFTTTPFKDLWIIEPNTFQDHRGTFYESFHLKKFQEATGLKIDFIQDNHSISTYGVMRGLHFQFGEYAQSKLVRVIRGVVIDVVVDLRKSSTTYGQHFHLILSAENRRQLFIPKGFAHGFAVLSPEAEFVYKCDNFYSNTHEGGIIFNDPDLKINWQIPEDQIVVSDKDRQFKPLAQTHDYFD